MNPKRAQLAAQLVAPVLRAGEQVHQVGLASVNPVTLGGSLLRSAATLIASGGTMNTLTAVENKYLVLTNERMIFLGATAFSGKPTDKIVAEISRAAITAIGEDRRGATTSWDIALAGQEKGLRVVFPAGNRDEALAISAELRAALRPTR